MKLLINLFCKKCRDLYTKKITNKINKEQEDLERIYKNVK